MARIETDPNYTAPTFSRATAATDPFKKEDVQNLAAAMSTHDHSTGKGVAVPFATAIPNGTITSAMIADGTIDTADLKDGSVTSAKIADGTIATADHAAASITNALLAADTARANLLTNGGFEIWQRGNGPFTANGVMTADRWNTNVGGSSTLSVSRETTNVDSGSVVSAALTYSHNAASAFVQKVEDVWQLKGRTLSFSIRVKTSTANAVRPRLDPIGGGGPYYGAYHTGDGTWQTLTLTQLVSGSTTSLMLMVELNASCTAFLDNAMLVVGSVPADYAPLHPADDLARCLRYYEIIGSGSDVIISGIATAGAQGVYQPFTYRAVKAVVPTVTLSTWSNSNCATPTINAGTPYLFRITTTSSAAGPFFSQTTGLLTSEANP